MAYNQAAQPERGKRREREGEGERRERAGEREGREKSEEKRETKDM